MYINFKNFVLSCNSNFLGISLYIGALDFQGIKRAWIGFLPGLNRAVLTLTHKGASRPLVYYLKFQHIRPAVVSSFLEWIMAFSL